MEINAAFFVGLLSLNFLFEIAICAFVAPIVATGLRIALGIDKRGRRPVVAPQPAEAPAERIVAESADSEEKKTDKPSSEE